MGPYVSQSPEIPEWADRLLFDVYRRMSPQTKMRMVSELCHATALLKLRALALRHPTATPGELELRLAEQHLGRELLEQVVGRELPYPADG